MPTTTVKGLKEGTSTADVLNAIRATASQSYKDAVPIVNMHDINTLNRVGEALYTYAPHRNYFIQELFNRIAVVFGRNKIYTNPYKWAKIGTLNFGESGGR